MRVTPRFLVVFVVLGTALFITDGASAQSEAHAVMTRIEDGPDVRQVQREALRATGLASARDKRWASRARLSHLLPDVRGEVAWLDQRDIEFSYREDVESDGDDLVTDSRNDYVDDARLRGVYAVRLEWELSGLVFDPEELDAARAAERRHVARAELLQIVTDVYFERRKWQVELALTPRSHIRPRIEAKLAVDRATAKLDAFTGGWYSRQLDGAYPNRNGRTR